MNKIIITFGADNAVQEQVELTEQELELMLQKLGLTEQEQEQEQELELIVQEDENIIILPQFEFRDDYKPVPLRRTKIKKVVKDLEGYTLEDCTKSFEINIINNKQPRAQLHYSREVIMNHLLSTITSLKGERFKFVQTLKVTFTKKSDSDYFKSFNSVAQAYFNCVQHPFMEKQSVVETLEDSKEIISNMIDEWVEGSGSGWTVKSVDNHYLNIGEIIDEDE